MDDFNNIKGKVFESLEIRGKEEDFCITVNNVADILAYAVPTVQTFIIPKLDRVYADKYIKGYMGNCKIKLIISKESLIKFLNAFMLEVERNTVYCLREDSEYLGEDFEKLKRITKSYRDMKDKMHQAAHELNKKYNSKGDFKTLGEDNVLEIIEYNLFSIRQIKMIYKFKHIMQIYRFLEKKNYIKIRLGNLKSSDTDYKKNIRYLFLSGTKWGVEHNCVYISLTNKTTNKIKSLSGASNVEIEKLIMESLISEIEKNN